MATELELHNLRRKRRRQSDDDLDLSSELEARGRRDDRPRPARRRRVAARGAGADNTGTEEVDDLLRLVLNAVGSGAGHNATVRTRLLSLFAQLRRQREAAVSASSCDRSAAESVSDDDVDWPAGGDVDADRDSILPALDHDVEECAEDEDDDLDWFARLVHAAPRHRGVPVLPVSTLTLRRFLRRDLHRAVVTGLQEGKDLKLQEVLPLLAATREAAAAAAAAHASLLSAAEACGLELSDADVADLEHAVTAREFRARRHTLYAAAPRAGATVNAALVAVCAAFDDALACGDVHLALVLLAFPHGTAAEKLPRHGAPDGVVVWTSPDGDTYHFLYYPENEKREAGHRVIPRLILVHPDVCADIETLTELCAEGQIKREAIRAVKPLATRLGLGDRPLWQRRVGSSLIWHFLLFDERGRRLDAALSLRGPLALLNAAQGHGHLSNCWGSYVRSFRGAA